MLICSLWVVYEAIFYPLFAPLPVFSLGRLHLLLYMFLMIRLMFSRIDVCMYCYQTAGSEPVSFDPAVHGPCLQMSCILFLSIQYISSWVRCKIGVKVRKGGTM